MSMFRLDPALIAVVERSRVQAEAAGQLTAPGPGPLRSPLSHDEQRVVRDWLDKVDTSGRSRRSLQKIRGWRINDHDGQFAERHPRRVALNGVPAGEELRRRTILVFEVR